MASATNHRPDPEVAKLAYEAATKRLERQIEKLGEIRQRTTLLLGTAAIATSFLADTALSDRATDFSLAVYVGFVAAGVAVALSMVILMPSRAGGTDPRDDGAYGARGGGASGQATGRENNKNGWKFDIHTDELIDFYYYGNYSGEDGQEGRPHSLQETHATLATQMASWHRRNERGFGRLHQLFIWASVSIGVDVVAWLIDLLWFYERTKGATP